MSSTSVTDPAEGAAFPPIDDQLALAAGARNAAEAELVAPIAGVLANGRLHLGGALSTSQFELLTCEADLAVLLEHAGRRLSLGRTTRTIPDTLRAIIIDRDGGCRVPGCGRTIGLDVHHLHHWSNGGQTNPNNVVTLCRRHHTQLHQGQITITGNPEQLPKPGQPDGLTYRNSAGRELKHQPPTHHPPERGQSPRGAPSEADSDSPPRKHRYQHPLGERLQRWAVHFNRNDQYRDDPHRNN